MGLVQVGAENHRMERADPLPPLHLTRPYPGSCMPRAPVRARLVASVMSDSLLHGL